MDPNEYGANQRGARAAYLIAIGRKPTTRELANELGMTHNGAYRLLQRICCVLPIYTEPSADGERWHMLPPPEDWPY